MADIGEKLGLDFMISLEIFFERVARLTQDVRHTPLKRGADIVLDFPSGCD